MTIQAAREMIAKNASAFRAADTTFAKSVNDRYEAMKAKSANPHPADLRRLANDVKAWINAEIAKPSGISGESAPAIDAAIGWGNLIQAEIDIVAYSSHGGVHGEAPSGWVDAVTGAPMRVLAPEQTIATGMPSKASVGGIVASLLTGKSGTPEVQAALSEGTGSAGGYSIPLEVLSEFFDKLRAKTMFIKAGAQTLMLNGMQTRIMRIAADPSPAWRLENSAITESQPTFDKVDFMPQSLAVVVRVSTELLMDSANAADAIEASILGSLSVELDRVCMFGSGTLPEPLGLFNAPGVNTVSMGANGATPINYDALIDAIYSIEAANGGPVTAAIMNPRTARTYRKLKDTLGQPLRLPPFIDTLPMLTSSAVPVNQTQGTSTGVSSTTVVGDFSKAILGMRQMLTIQRLDQTYAATGQIGFLATMRADVGFSHPDSFTRIVGVL